MEFAGSAFDHAVALEHANKRTKEAFAVKGKALALHVFTVEGGLHGDFQFVAAVNLGPAGKTYGHIVGTVLVAFGNQVELIPQSRARADNAHGAAENIEHLREFIQAGLAQEPANSRNPLLGVAQFVGRSVLRGVGTHGAELVDVKMCLVQAHAFLLEEHRALAIQFDGDCYGKHREREHHNAETRKNDIDKTFEEMLIHHWALLKIELQATLVAAGTTAPV